MNMAYCPVCGTRLHRKEHPTDGSIPYCDTCGDYRFPFFSTAISAIVLDETKRRMLLIRQYGDDEPVLVAGYVDKGETAEQAVVREIREELGMTARELHFKRSHYYEPSETLMLNYTVTVPETTASPNLEVDSWFWVPVEETPGLVHPGGLAETLLGDFFEKTEETKNVP